MSISRLAVCVTAVLLLSTPRCSLAARDIPRDGELIASDHEGIIGDVLNVGINEEPSREEKECLRYLAQYMPEADRKALHYDFLHNQVHLALQARADNDWALDLPWDIFLNYVLPYASLDEPREDWRTSFYAKFAPLVGGTSTTLEAAVALNYQIWTLGDWNITFKSAQTPEIMSPSQVIEHGYASCTGLAIFFVDACRAVGIPARVAGIAEWKGSGGNHNWVEVWHNGVWSFSEPLGWPDRPWNQTWFFPDPVQKSVQHSYANGVYSTSFKRTGVLFPLAWHDEYESQVPAHEVTKYYIDAAAAQGPAVAGSGGRQGAQEAAGADVDVADRADVAVASLIVRSSTSIVR